MTTPRLHLPQLVSQQEMTNVTWNEALAQLDATVDVVLLGQYVNAPPSGPRDGDAYLVGGAPTGAWTGYAYKIASCLDGAWRFYTPFNGLRAYVAASGAFIVYVNGQWTDWNSLISAGEAAIASAATCDLGAAGSLFVQITGTTAITSFGTAANKLRFVRFAQALTLTHNATSLVLLGGASRVAAAGDVGIYASDASGNWHERSYARAGANPGDFATRSGTETFANKTFSGATAFPGSTVVDANGHIGVAAAPGSALLALSNCFAVDGGGNIVVGQNNVATMSLPQFVFGSWQNNGTPRPVIVINGPGAYAGIGQATTNGIAALRIGPNSATAYGASWPALNSLPFSLLVDGTLSIVGNMLPASDNASNIGSASLRFGTVFAATGTINTSAAAAKRDVAALSPAEMAVARTLAGGVRLFRFADAVARKGDGARIHAGMLFEDVVAAFEAQDLDPMRYGIVCRDRDESDPEKWILGLRYAELAQFVIAGLAARIASLEAR